MSAEPAAAERLERLLSYVEADPKNEALLVDAAEAALGANEGAKALDLLYSLSELRELGDRELNLVGLASLQSQDHARAAAIFATLLKRHEGDANLRFNLAWSRYRRDDNEGAIAALDEPTVAALPQAATLKVQLLHDQGAMEKAEAVARAALEAHASHPPLLAAVSVLAVDIGDLDLAGACATRAGDHPDALATLGTLALDDDDVAAARALFRRALDANPNVARAWVGRGLTALADGDAAEAARDIDRGADLFGDHLGSIIAAGWAHFLAGDTASARLRFEHALEIDPTFAETHGSLAVTDILDGRLEDAERKIEIALRLDRRSFSVVFAQLLMRTGRGDAEGAKRILERALEAPVDENGRTLGQMLARTSLARR